VTTPHQSAYPTWDRVKSGLIGTLLFSTTKILSQPIWSSTSGRPDRIVHLTHIHTTDQKSMVFYTGLASPELIPRLGHRKKCPKGTRQNVRKKFFLQRLLGPTSDKLDTVVHLTHIHLANQRNMIVAKHLAALELIPRLRRTSRAPPPQGRKFFFFGGTFASDIDQTGQDGASLSCAHRTSQTSGLLQKLGCQPGGEKKKNSEFRTFLGHCGTWPG
jgi:hypothetical protein